MIEWSHSTSTLTKLNGALLMVISALLTSLYWTEFTPVLRSLRRDIWRGGRHEIRGRGENEEVRDWGRRGGTTYILLVIEFFLVTRALNLVMDVSEGIGSSADSLGVVYCHLGFFHPHIQFIIFPPPTPEQIRQSIYLQGSC